MVRLRFSFILLASIIITTVSCASSPKAPAQSSSTPGIVLPTKAAWEVEWEKVVTGAKNERKVAVWTAGGNWPTARPLMSEAMKKIYGIDVEIVTATSLLLLERLFRERKAGIYDVDILLASGSGAVQLKKADVLDRLEPALILPEVVDPKAWMGGDLYWIDAEHTQLVFGGGIGPFILINTGMVKPEEITSMHDFLNPKWKGKILMFDPTTSGSGQNQFMVLVSNELGTDYVRELLKQEPVITRDARQNVDWIAKGVYPILLGFSSGIVNEYQKAGAPIKVLVPPKEAAFYGTFNSILTLMKNAPHPYSAKLFSNWLLSREGQMLVTGPIGTPSRRLDIPNKELVEPALALDPSVKYRMIDNPDEIARFGEYQQKIADVFLPYLRK